MIERQQKLVLIRTYSHIYKIWIRVPIAPGSNCQNMLLSASIPVKTFIVQHSTSVRFNKSISYDMLAHFFHQSMFLYVDLHAFWHGTFGPRTFRRLDWIYISIIITVQLYMYCLTDVPSIVIFPKCLTESGHDS